MTTIEVGKFYKDDEGDKVEIVAIRNNAATYTWTNLHGELMSMVGELDYCSEYWTPWPNEPEIPWESVPAWCQWWAADEDGEQVFFECEPSTDVGVWLRAEGGMVVPPKSHRIHYTGDWRESLRQRPGKEGK